MTLLDVVLPRRCAVCGRVGASLCGTCLARLVRCAPPWCERCGAPGPWPVRRCAECAGRRLAFSFGPRGARLRRRRARVRGVVEGAWTARSRRRRRRGRRRRCPEAGRRCDHVRPRRSRSAAQAGARAGRGARSRARRRLVDPVRDPAAPAAGDRPAARPAEGRAPRERRRGVLPEVAVAAACLPRRRRLHDGLDGDGVRHGAPPRRGSHGRSRLFCAGGAVVG